MLKQCLEVFEILDCASANGNKVKELFQKYGNVDVQVSKINGNNGSTDFVRILIKGVNGKTEGGTSPTLGITGRLGGLGARPEITGFVSDGDGAFAALVAGLKILDMSNKGDALKGDVIVTTHICPNAPTIPHYPVALMDSPVDTAIINELEVKDEIDAVLSVDTTKGNKVLNSKGFAITSTVKEGYILKVSDDLLNIMMRVTGKMPVVLPISMQDITPYGNGIYHLNSIMQPSVATKAPVVGIAITTEVPVAGCATGATHIYDIEMTSRYLVEVAKDFTSGLCNFFENEEFEKLVDLYGSMAHLQKTK